MNILEIKNLSLKISDKKILDNINFTLKEKEIVSIIGQSGSGKTMLSKMIMGLKNKNMQVEGEILFKDKNIFDFSEEDLRKYRGEGIGYITQNPLNVFLPFQKIKTTFLETYLSHKNVSKKEIIEFAKKNLKQVNLDNADEILNKYPFELSGGMLQRVMIALIVGLDSKIIIADEVTSALDSYNRYEIIKIFKELNNIGKSIILITHDYYLMKAISDRCLVMENGEVIEEFNPKLKSEVIKESSNFGTKLLETTIYRRKGSEMKAIELINIVKKYGQQEVLNSFSLDIEKGKCLAVMGESGSGKSTIAKIIIGLEKPNSGEVKIFDKDIEFLFQDSYNALNPRMTVEDLIYEPLQFSTDIDVKDKREFILELLKQVELAPELLTRRRDELSGGQLQRVCLARALSTKPQIMIFDESLSGLDPLVQDKILDLLYKIQKEYNLTYIFISHDFRLCYFLADRIILIDKGKIIEDFKDLDKEIISKTEIGKILLENIIN